MELSTLEHILSYPLWTLSGSTITVKSLLVASVVVLLFWLFAAFAKAALGRLLVARGLPPGTQFAAAKILGYVIVLIGVLVAVHSVGLNLTALLAASTVVLVGIGLGLQQVAQNFVAGVIVLLEQPVRRGDFIRVGDTFGEVINIGLRATTVLTRDEATIIVPNSELVTGQVVNHSVPTTRIRMSVTVGVAYGTDTARVRETLEAVAAAEPLVLDDPAPEVRFENFGDSSLDFALLVWIADPELDRRIASTLRFAIDAAFRAQQIEIPFPQRDLHIRSGLLPAASGR